MSLHQHGTCTLHHIKHALGIADFGDRRAQTYVTALIADRHFPPPLPSLFKRQLTNAVTRNSRWLRAPVDHWFDDQLPPDTHTALDAASMRDAATRMDARAGNLQLVAGTTVDRRHEARSANISPVNQQRSGKDA